MRPSLIRWRDAYDIGTTWLTDVDDIPGPVIVSTVGYIIKDAARDGYVVVADSMFDGEGGRVYGGVSVIPAEMVIESRKLT